MLFFEQIKQLDTNLFLFLNGIHSPFWDAVMYQVSGRVLWIPLYLIILYYIVRKYKWESWKIFIGVIVLILMSDQLSVHLFKNIFERLRPCHNPDIQSMVHLVYNKCGGKYGFVSSHAANTFAMAVFTLLVFRNKWYTIGILFWAAFVSYSRIYLGVHYPADVLCGALLGVGCGILVYFLSEKLKTKSEK